MLSTCSGVAYTHICKVLISQYFNSCTRLSTSIINDPLHKTNRLLYFSFESRPSNAVIYCKCTDVEVARRSKHKLQLPLLCLVTTPLRHNKVSLSRALCICGFAGPESQYYIMLFQWALETWLPRQSTTDAGCSTDVQLFLYADQTLLHSQISEHSNCTSKPKLRVMQAYPPKFRDFVADSQPKASGPVNQAR